MRLNKFLARAGVASRRHAERLITEGKVCVNRKVVTVMGYQVDPEKDEVHVDGRKITLNEEHVYILLNKPSGYVTTVHDPQGRPKVMDLIKNVPHRLYPVGRLDFATEGLLLLTNDGELTLRLTHPRYRVPKTYLAQVRGIPEAETLNKIRKGVKLEDGLTAPTRVRIRRVIKGKALLELTLIEGRNREVRRMLEAVGYPVIRLKRIKLAFLDLKGLKTGEYRHLNSNEINRLYKLVGLQK